MLKKYILPGLVSILVLSLLFWVYFLTRENGRLKFENGNMDYFYRHTIDSIATERKKLDHDNDSLRRVSAIKEVNIVLLESKLEEKDKLLKYETNKVNRFTPATRNLYLDSLLKSEHLR